MRRTPLLLLLSAAVLATVLFLLNQSGDTTDPDIEPPGLHHEVEAAASGADTSLAQANSADTTQARQAVASVLSKEERLAKKKSEEKLPPAGPFLRGAVFGSDGRALAGTAVKVEGDIGGEGILNLGKIALSQEAVTDRSGEFKVPRGRWPGQDVNVELKARGYQPARMSRAPDRSSGDAQLGTFVLQRGVVLGGQVFTAKGTPVEGATVRRTTLEDKGAMDKMIEMASTFGGMRDSRTTTDAEGRFELPYEEVGFYALIVEHEDYPKARIERETPPEGGEDLTIVIRLAPTAIISGRIIDFPEGKSGVTVMATPVELYGSEAAPVADLFGPAFSTNDKSQVNSAGEFEITGLEVARNYKLQAFVQEGFFARTACSDPKEVSSDTTTAELVWNSGAKVVFDVEDAATGKPLHGIVVRHRWMKNTGNFMAMSSKKRDFETSHIILDELRPAPSPGQLEFSVFVEGYLEERRADIEVNEFKTVELGVIRMREAPLLRVRVLDASTGKGIRSARVVLRPEHGTEGDIEDNPFFSLGGEVSTGKTDSDGLCVMKSCATPTAELTVNKGGYVLSKTAGVVMPTDGTAEEVVRLSVGGEVAIQVFKDNGEPAADARVSHRDPEDEVSTFNTNARGQARVRNLAPGTHAFNAERGGERRRGVVVNVNDRRNGEQDVEKPKWREVLIASGTEASLEFRLPATAQIEGRVFLGGQPIAQATITLLAGEEASEDEEMRARISEQASSFMPNAPAVARTDSQGRFELDDIEIGKYRLRVGREGGAPAHYTPIDVRVGTNRVDITLPNAAVEGRIVDEQGKPIRNATVELRRFDPEDPTNTGNARLDLTLSFFGASKSNGVRTDSEGHYRIESVPVDVPYVVVARATGFVRNQSKDFKVAKNAVQSGMDATLSRSGSIRVHVEGASGPFQSVSAEFQGDSKGAPSSSMAFLSDGKALLEDLAPGTWRVSIERDTVFEIVEVKAGAESFVHLAQ